MICHLDTCIVIAYLNGNQTVAKKLKLHLPNITISSLVWGELLYGARASARSLENIKKLQQFKQLVNIANFDEKSADFYSQIRLYLRKKGRPIGETDMLIAAIALATNAVLVTDNTKHFENIEDLILDNWLQK
ncbi:MAG: type II toxin-antitoxin system VapC family toxin [Thiomargarita sp.]|nr:type II toxin-antitoxin system VapC family toxin [Thiomargarita sp.]